MDRVLEFRLLPRSLSICRLPAAEPLPDWGERRGFYSLTRTDHELSLVCPSAWVAPGWRHSPGWRALELAGPLELEQVGILAQVAACLAGAGVSIFTLSTFDTDYILVREKSLEAALAALAARGYWVQAGK